MWWWWWWSVCVYGGENWASFVPQQLDGLLSEGRGKASAQLLGRGFGSYVNTEGTGT